MSFSIFWPADCKQGFEGSIGQTWEAAPTRHQTWVLTFFGFVYFSYYFFYLKWVIKSRIKIILCCYKMRKGTNRSLHDQQEKYVSMLVLYHNFSKIKNMCFPNLIQSMYICTTHSISVLSKRHTLFWTSTIMHKLK